MFRADSQQTEAQRLSVRLLQILTGNWGGIRGATPPTVPMDIPPVFREERQPPS